MSKRNALLLMVLVTLIWSTNGLLIKLVSWSPMAISGWRSLFTALVLLPFLGNPGHMDHSICWWAVFVLFRVGVLAYNAGKLLLCNTLDRSWSRYQAQTLRWRFYQTAGKIVYHAGSVWLKIRREMVGLFSRVRYRNWEFANG